MTKLIKNNKTVNRSLGFTLVELMVAIMIIVILSGVVLSLLNSSGVRAKARDSERVADLKRIQVALELYFSDYRVYPRSSASGNNWLRLTGSDVLALGTAGPPPTPGLVPNYINILPIDPVQTGTNVNPCAGAGLYRYNYRVSTDRGRYVLTAIMEIPTSVGGNGCASLYNWTQPSGSQLGCGTPVAGCYGVQNP
jgi:prepilin-type N-terminal cleavage/methylation domain-containing protein